MLEQDKVERIESRDLYFLFLFFVNNFLFVFYLYFSVCVSFLVKKNIDMQSRICSTKLAAIM